MLVDNFLTVSFFYCYIFDLLIVVLYVIVYKLTLKVLEGIDSAGALLLITHFQTIVS